MVLDRTAYLLILNHIYYTLHYEYNLLQSHLREGLLCLLFVVSSIYTFP